MKNNNKTITIIVILAVILLLIGGTLAWIRPDIEVTNGHYVIETESYEIDYVKGNHVTNLPQVVNPTTGNTANILIKAKKTTSNFNANLTIYLNTLSETDVELINEKVINYAVCTNTCTSFTKPFVLTSTNKTPIIENIALTTSYTDINIYFWLDGYTEMNNLVNKSYSGYISAEATLIPA